MKPATILIFDDEPDILQLCKLFLTKSGYRVVTKLHCREVIEDIEACQPDLVLMDNLIPDVGGVVSTQLIKGHPNYNKLPVIFFTANNHIEQLCAQAGADAFLSKPFDFKTMLNIVERFIKHS